jgi:hypothetical protein
VGAILYVTAFSSIKLSILLLYLRLFGVTHRKTRLAVWALIVLVACVGISGLFGFLFLCDPVKKLFVFSSPGKCNFAAINQLSRAQSFLHVFTDILLTTVPIPMIVRLRLPPMQRLGVIFVMTTGLIVTVFSIIRLSVLYPKRAPPQGASVSMQYNMTFWSILELNVALICTSAPALKQFIGGTFPVMRDYASSLTSKIAGGSGHLSQRHGDVHNGHCASARLPWTRKSSKWDSSSDGGANDGVEQETSISMDRRVKDGSYVELGPVKAVTEPPNAYGHPTHVSAGRWKMHNIGRGGR